VTSSGAYFRPPRVKLPLFMSLPEDSGSHIDVDEEGRGGPTASSAASRPLIHNRKLGQATEKSEPRHGNVPHTCWMGCPGGALPSGGQVT
jgi:hypothetical protein